MSDINLADFKLNEKDTGSSNYQLDYIRAKSEDTYKKLIDDLKLRR